MRKRTAADARHESESVPGLVCTLRVSSRVLHPRLKMMPHEGLVLVLPRRYDRRTIDALLLRHQGWIVRAVARVQSVHAAMDEVASAALLPQTVSLPCTGEQLMVQYRDQGHGGGVRVVASGERAIVLCGEIADSELCRSVLRRWLQQRGSRDLLPMLHDLSVRHDLRFLKAAVRLQKSRWGSCSSKRVIALNAKLLFLPPSLSRSVMLHELCHTVHLNHSRLFRELLACHDPEWREHDRDLRTGWRYVPRWVDHEVSDSVFLP